MRMRGDDAFSGGGGGLAVKETDAPLWVFRTARALCSVLLSAGMKVRVRGREHIPSRGGVIVASNHQSFLDPVLLGCASRRPFAFLARDSLFRSALFGGLIRSLNSYPVPRDSLSPEALRRAVAVLRKGWPLVVFPEGTRTRDGRMGPLRRGVSLLAVRAGVPVLPARIDGAFLVWPRQHRLPRSGKIRVAFGPLLLYDTRTDTYGGFTERIARSIAALGAQSAPGREGGADR